MVLEDEEPWSISRLTAFLYSGDYEDRDGISTRGPGKVSDSCTFIDFTPSAPAHKSDDPVLASSRIYIASEKYDIQPFKLLAAAKYKAAVATLEQPSISRTRTSDLQQYRLNGHAFQK